MAFLRRHWPWLLLVLFPLLPLGKAVFTGQAIGPFDQIRHMAPWNGPEPGRPFDVLQADGALQFFPWRDMVFEAWSRGELPLWNPFQLAGTPLLANSQSAGFYPPHILMGLLHVPTPIAMALLAWFHLAWAALGVMALSRRLGASREGAAVAGVLFSGSAFMIAWTVLPSVISTCAWIPWALAAIYGLFERDENRGQIRSAALLAFSIAMMLLAGHLQFAFYGLLAAGLLLVARATGEMFGQSSGADTPKTATKPLVPLFLGVAGMLLGAGLAAPQILPVLEYSKFSHRRNVPSEEGYQAYVAGGIAPFELVGLVYPTATGLPSEFAPDAKPLGAYWPALVKQGANFAEGAIGIGPVALFGLIVLPWRRASKRLWIPIAGLGLFALLMALGTFVNKPFYFLIPGWSSTGSPGRIGVLFVMGACALAGVGLWRGEPNPKTDRLGGFAVLAISALTILAAFQVAGSFAPRFEGMDPALIGKLGAAASSRLALGIVGALSLCMLIGFLLEQKRKGALMSAFSVGFPAVAFGATFSGLWGGLIPVGAPLDKNVLAGQEHAPAGRAAFVNEPWELVVAAPALMPPNTASLLRIPDLAGYDSLLHRDTQLFLADVNGQDSAPPANGNIQFVKPSADPQKLGEAGVTVVYSQRPVFEKLTPQVIGEGLLRYSIPSSGRTTVIGRAESKPFPPAKVEDGFDHQTVTEFGPGLLVVKDRLIPGWNALIDGKPVEWDTSHPWKTPDGREVNLWRQVSLPPGEHKVEFRYDPPGMRTGFLLFLPCLVATGLLAYLGRRR